MPGAGAELTGVCRNRGAVGGLHALTALEGGPLTRVYLQPMPAQGGFHAAFAGELAHQDSNGQCQTSSVGLTGLLV